MKPVRATARVARSALAAGLLAAGLAACRQPAPEAADAGPAHRAQLAQVHEACVAAMIRSTCQVMVGSAPVDAATTVVIAGVGRIDAKAYRELRDAGDAMCGVARGACEKDWEGGSCRSARALWATEQVAAR